MELVEVPGADSVAREVPVGFKLAHDPVRSALGYPGADGYLT